MRRRWCRHCWTMFDRLGITLVLFVLDYMGFRIWSMFCSANDSLLAGCMRRRAGRRSQHARRSRLSSSRLELFFPVPPHASYSTHLVRPSGSPPADSPAVVKVSAPSSHRGSRRPDSRPVPVLPSPSSSMARLRSPFALLLPLFLLLASTNAYQVLVSNTDDVRQVCSGMYGHGAQDAFIEGQSRSSCFLPLCSVELG